MTEWQAFMRTRLRPTSPAGSDLAGTSVGQFGDLDREYLALGEGPALVDRSYRGLLEITGRDRVGWLQNLTTNDVKGLAPGQGCYAFALNRLGRILFDLNVLVRDEAIHVDLDRRFVPSALSHFAKYIVTEDVGVTDRTSESVRLGLSGLAAARMLEEMGAPDARALPQLATSQILWSECQLTFIRHDFCGPFAVELFVPAALAVRLWQDLSDPLRAGRAVLAGADAVQVRRIEAGIPWPGHEITEEYLPAETGQLARAVSFTKGCYLGQEIVGRMRSHGAVARQLVSLEIDADAVPCPGADLADNSGRAVGHLTSSCRSIAGTRTIGLGYVKTPSAAPGTPLTVVSGSKSVRATVARPAASAPTGEQSA